MATDHICNTNATIGWLESILQDCFSTDAKIDNWTAERIGIKQGYLSTMLRVSLEWSKEFPLADEAKRVVLKLPNSEGLDGLMAEGVDKVDHDSEDSSLVKSHNDEVEFYKLFRGKPTPCKLPKCYYGEKILPGNRVPCLIMEDLSDKGYVPRLADGLSTKQCKQVFEHFAAIHAWSLKHSHWKDIADLDNSFLHLERCHPGFCEGLAKRGVDELVGKHAARFPDIERKIRAHFTSVESTIGEVHHMHERLRMPAVLCHGDFWTNNLFLVKTDAPPSADDHVLCVFDWQMAHAGCAAEDLAMALLFSATAEVRRAHGATLLAHYYSALTSALAPAPPPFSVATLREGYELTLRGWAALGVGMFMTIAADQCVGDDAAWQLERLLQRCEAVVDDFLQLPAAPTNV